MFTATRLQIASYLLGVCPFSIAFLVFLNSSVSFVVTDLIHVKHGVGDAVGTLGFADELLALVACPFWGILSDRIGVRSVRCQPSLCHVNSPLTLLGLCRWICPYRSCVGCLRSMQECLSSTTPRTTAIQLGWSRSIDNGDGCFADYVSRTGQLG